MTKIKEKANHFWRNGLSIDETKVSLLMIMMLVAFGVAIWQVITLGDLSPNLMQLLFMIIGSVAGVNIVSTFTNKNVTSAYDNGKMTIEQNQNYYDEYGIDEKHRNNYDDRI